MTESEKPAHVRLFFGMPLPEELVLPVTAIRGAVEREKLRAIAIENVHVTLKFLGWMASEHVPELARGLDAIGEAFPKVHASAKELGGFPKPARARVFVLSLEDEGSLEAMANVLETLAERFGVARETRRFRAHATLARTKVPQDVRRLIESIRWEALDVTLDRVTLYQSTMFSSGSVYTPLATVELA